jgi:hypothetical protein
MTEIELFSNKIVSMVGNDYPDAGEKTKILTMTPSWWHFFVRGS